MMSKERGMKMLFFKRDKKDNKGSTAESKTEKVEVAVPEGFDKYLELSSNKREKDISAPKKSREDIIKALEELRKSDRQFYSEVYDILKPFFADGLISVSMLQRKCLFGFARAEKILDTLVLVGLVDGDYGIRPLTVSEQELMSILAEIELAHQ